MRSRWKEASEHPRFCEICSKTLERRRDPAGRLEGYRDFMRRRFCSLSCANSRRKGGESRSAYLYHARKFVCSECEACGAASELQVHHVDTDWKNSSPSNLQTLCLFCHHFWHAAHERLGETPTRRMPRLGILSSSEQGVEWDECAPTATRSAPRKRKSSLGP